MLKLHWLDVGFVAAVPAAFRRLCVETLSIWRNVQTVVPAAFRRLCVETS